jgi:hypothetical protein
VWPLDNFQVFYETFEIHYRINKRFPLVFISSQTNPVHTTPSYPFKIYLNVIRPPKTFSS